MADWKDLSPEERKAEMARRVKARKGRKGKKRPYHHHAKGRTGGKEGAAAQASGQEVAYAVGYTQAWLEQYARHVGVPIVAFTFAVADLLRRQTVRAARGTGD